MSEAAPGKGRPRSGRHLARVFALLGLYQWLADPQLRFADVTAKLEGLIADEAGEELDGAHLTSDDFARADRELFACSFTPRRPKRPFRSTSTEI